MRVLHVGRDKFFARIIRSIIVKNGFAYKYMNSLEKACYEIRTNRFHLIVIDRNVHSPYIVKMIRKSNSLAYNQIIVVSPDDDFKTKKYYFKLGVMAYFYKNQFDAGQFEYYLKTLSEEMTAIETLRNMKIAVVDDNPFSLDVVKKFFVLRGIKTVDYYRDPLEFLNRQENYDLCFIDLLMPVYDGETLICSIRRSNKDTIIIIITGYSNEKIIMHCLRMGADDFVLKPLDYTIFMSRINSCISRHRLNGQLLENNKQLFELATRDALTGVYNRTYFMDIYKRKAAEILRTNDLFSLILLDIDYFKNINDEYGHLKGDYVLRETAQLLNRNLRKSDVLCRWGGEEFIILLGQADSEKAAVAAENMRRLIENNNLRGLRKITASFGVTEYSRNDDDADIFTVLDNSLYLAKLTGRNRVICNGRLRLLEAGKIHKIEWGPFFKSGHPDIDREHHRLINLANEIISEYFPQPQVRGKNLFKLIIEEMNTHFRHEEDILKSIGYKKYEEHKTIHRELIIRSLSLYESFFAGTETVLSFGSYIIEEVLIGHILEYDFDFFTLLRQGYSADEHIFE